VVRRILGDPQDIATFDGRHFRAMRPARGGAFRLLPIDASRAGIASLHEWGRR
jgi:hypothetical protein